MSSENCASSSNDLASKPIQNKKPQLSCGLPSRCEWSLGTTKADPHRHVPFTQPAKIKNSVLECVGNSPMVRLNRIPAKHNLKCEVLVKCEYFNAGGSVKDRIAIRMIEDAEAKGLIKPGFTLIEPTSGNTGIGIALAAAVKGYRCIIVMPEKMSAEKADVLKILGAEIIRTPTNVASDSPDSHISVAERLRKSIKNAVVLDQYRNPGNPLAHYDGTAEEILDACDGKIDMLVAGVGTGGTISGIARKIKERLPDCQIVGVDPHGSILAHDENEDVLEGFYEVEGIGYDFYPTVLDKKLIDKWVKTEDKSSFQMSRELILLEGLLCGGSSGAAMSAAVQAAAGLEEGKRVVVLLPDGIRNYMTKFVNDEWMLQRNYIDEALEEEHAPWYHMLKVSVLPIMNRLQTIDSDMRIKAAVHLMKTHGYDQLPVVQKETGQLLGVITMQMALSSVIGHKLSFDDHVEKCVTNDFPKLDSDESLGKLSRLLKRFHFVLIVHQGQEQTEKVIGIVTHVDILNYLLQATPTSN